MSTGSSMKQDVLDGFPAFAHFIAKDRDAAIYRRFESLSARNLLYQQSELNALKDQLEKIDDVDFRDDRDMNNEDGRRAARDWSLFQNDNNERAKARRKLQANIKSKIKEYREVISAVQRTHHEICTVPAYLRADEALLLESRVLALNSPAARTLESFLRWYESDGNRPDGKTVLWELDALLFEDHDDLVALAPVDNDRLNIFLRSAFAWLFPPGNLIYYSEKSIQLLGTIISILLSSVILIGAIVFLLLASKRSIELQVGVVVIFTFLFAAVVGLLTNARRAEIFGSSAAYAAVLVVFVSNLR